MLAVCECGVLPLDTDHHTPSPPPPPPPVTSSLRHLLSSFLLHHHTPPIIPGPTEGSKKMSVIPQTLQMVKSQHQKKASMPSNGKDRNYGFADLDQPTRYSSKLMNSIWGRYNENSVHNFKSLQCGGVAMATTSTSYSSSSASPLADQYQQQQQQYYYQSLQQYPMQQQQQQQMWQGQEEGSPSLARRSEWQQRMGELGEAVAANFMDNLNQY
ncbi:hypothetical protein Pmani_034532 [Petrolisthes manimaculis]|uniref:Uncharacterized protein n=1 Tax=Petrolisthes manimaculis TaxID=1843537 RepID=A0AAE1TRH7_9EUCA|nr:hypothetical protein Pmani_034532 [Petrolisthes manimaculis]